MNVDLDAIAQRGHCEVSSLRLALPLIEQGYTPPFLARYRRDELGGVDEPSLWALSHAVRSQQRLETYRDELHAAWQATQLADPALGRAISGARSRRLLDRLSRRVKSESNESASLAQRLAVRMLSPEKGDGEDIEAIAASLIASREAEAAPVTSSQTPPELGETEAATTPEAVSEPSGSTSPIAAAVAKLDDAIAKRLTGDPRIIGAAVRWLSRQAKIHVLEVSDPHGNDDDGDEESLASAKPGKASRKKKKRKTASEKTAETQATATKPAATETTPALDSPPSVEGDLNTALEDVAPEDVAPEDVAPENAAATETPVSPVVEAPVTPVATLETAPQETAVSTAADSQPLADIPEATKAEPTGEVASASETSPAAETAPAAEAAPAPESASSEKQPAEATPSATGHASSEKKAPAVKQVKKKISPRQRRRRWLVSTLKPLSGKRMPAAKLSAFQIVMLGRALRSQVAQCAFDYDAAQLVAEMQKAASGLNRSIADHLAEIVLANEAALRDAAESAWWDEIQEQASARLVSIAADNLHRQINRGGVEAKVVMSIDAIGPRTAATSIVAADGRVLHNEDIPCQLSAAMRTLAVTKMGELIHQYHVDLIVISNGPARRACMIAVGELIKQSAEKSVRWTLAERSGADAYAGSAAGDQEMRSTPRRFRSAAWIAFSALQPSQAMVKVDPLKLRLGSFQRELSDQAVLDALEDVLVSGAARGGVDVNSATASWLERLPGMTRPNAEKIDAERRTKLIASRDDLLARGEWASSIHSRQALPFLRVFESSETLDATLIHPDDYTLAKRLAKSLELELPPASPPGYQLPDYSDPKPVEASEPAPAASMPVPEPTEDDDKAFGPVDEVSGEVTSESGGKPASDEPASEMPSSEVTASDDTFSDEVPADENAVVADSVTELSPVPESEPATVTESVSPETEPSAEATESFRQTKPERAKVEKLIKEWQVGTNRSLQIVSWLCEPFGDGIVSGPAPAVMTTMPAMSDLKEGDQVIGVVVGVMPFGVFVELTPECSGLIHVSRISDGFVEDLHEAVQVGDVVTAWVTGIDGKRRRVGLSAISPEREGELQSQRHQARGRDNARGGNPRGGDRGPRRGAAPNAAASRETTGEPRSGAPATGKHAQGANTPNERSQGGSRRDGRGGGREGGGREGGGRDGGRGRSAGGGRRDQQRGGSRGPRRPEVYEVVGKEPDSAPLTDAMQKGKEPLRSFGDLMQLFSQDKPKPAPAPEKKAATKPAPVIKDEAEKAETKQDEVRQDEGTPSPATPPASSPTTSAEPASTQSAPPKVETATDTTPSAEGTN